MSSENTARKFRVREYVRKYVPGPSQFGGTNRARLFTDPAPGG